MRSRRVQRARALLGVPFRAQGRDPKNGLDCLGLVMAACGVPAHSARRDYRLSGVDRREIETGLDAFLRRVGASRARPGDVLLLEITDCQPHLAIRTDLGFIHADVRLRKVVETPGPPPWPIVAAFRALKRSRTVG